MTIEFINNNRNIQFLFLVNTLVVQITDKTQTEYPEYVEIM